jgi:Flp pilus assembly protein CpaB
MVVIPLRILESLKPLVHVFWLQHTVVVSTNKLPAFHVINPKDVQIKSLIEPNAFTAPNDVVGRYTLQTISQGSVLRSDQVSTVQLSPADMIGRQILLLPIDSSVFPTVATPGSHVSLLFSPSGNVQPKLFSHTLDDVIILAINKRDKDGSLVVAVQTNASFEAVKPLLGTSKVFVLQKIP